MKQHARRFIVLVFAQSACLALGLWLEYRFVTSADRFAEKSGDCPSFCPGKNGTVPFAAASPAPPENAPAGPSDPAPATDQIPLAAIRAICFVWIAALQAGAAWLVLARASEADYRKQSHTENVSLQRYNDLLRTRDAVIFGLAKLAESRDPDTGNHLERIAIYSTRLASALRRNSPYRNQISAQFVQLIGISSSLHDIGKVGIADSILMKPGRFADEERLMMQLHVAIGGKCVQDIETRLGQSNFLQMARQIALCHHERWDGKGYPEGLSGEEIPLEARIVAVADVYDALSTKRVYKEAIPHKQCVEMIRAEAGQHFDPVVVDAFLEIEADFAEIVKRCNRQSDVGDCTSICPDKNGTVPFAASAPDVATARGNRYDDDLSLALELLDEWAGEPPDFDQPSDKLEDKTNPNEEPAHAS
jgi:HD-GYP domain-containing protein (c-di-GMP phosphodiesterase class II)